MMESGAPMNAGMNRALWAGGGLLLFALWRWSINEVWDGWCSVSAVPGACLAAFGLIRQRAGLVRGARRRSVRLGFWTLLNALLILCVVGMLNFIAVRHNARFDLTESGLFTLAPQSKQAARALKQDVRATAFFPSGRAAQATELMRRYAEESRYFRFELVDPDREPERAQELGVTAYGTVVLQVEGSKGKPIRVEAEQSSGQRSISLSEEKLTNALMKIARSGEKTVYFLEGHGEGDITGPQLNGYTRVATALGNQAFQVKPLFLARDPKVPADCTALVIAGPGQEPLPDEIAGVEKYLEAGGRVCVLIDPAPGASLAGFLDKWGLKTAHDLVVDASGAGRVYGAGPAMPLVKDYSPDHPITKEFKLLTFFPLARSIFPKEMPGDAQVIPFAETGRESFAEPFTGGSRRSRFNPATDHLGPIPLAAAVTRQTQSGRQARMVVIGSSNFISNAFFDKAANGDLFLNAINWLADEEQLIALRARPREDHRVTLSDQQMRGVFWLSVVILPATSIVLGAIVYWRRR